MNDILSVYTSSGTQIPTDSNFVAVVEEKIDSNHYLVRINNQLVEVISTDSEFNVGDRLVLQIVNVSNSKVELHVLGKIQQQLEGKISEFVHKLGIEPTQENTNIIRALLQQGVEPTKAEVKEIINILQRAGDNLATAREVIQLLIKNNIIPTKELVEYLARLTIPAKDPKASVDAPLAQQEVVKTLKEVVDLQLSPHKSLNELIMKLQELAAKEQPAADLREHILAKLFVRGTGVEQEKGVSAGVLNKIEGFVDRAQSIKLFNTMSSVSGENKIYAEVPLSLAQQQTPVRILYEQERMSPNSRASEHTIFVGVDLENSGEILARLRFTKNRYSIDIYAEKPQTHKLMKENLSDLSRGLEAQGFKGVINVHMEKKVKFPPLFRTSLSALDLVA